MTELMVLALLMVVIHSFFTDRH